MPRKKARKIVLIMTDTQRTDYLGCYGNEHMKTPNLDSLAEKGIRFDKAYCAQPVCGPTRAAIMTGEYPHSNGSWANSMPLNKLSRTLGERMQKQGFHTAHIGKWHLDGGDYFGFAECPAGWDPEYWYDMRCYLEELSPEDRKRSRKQKTIYDDDFGEEMTYGHRCSNRAIDFLDKHNDEDFFLVVSYDEPHHPFVCPQEYVEMYKDYKFPLSENVCDSLEDKPEHQKAWAGNSLNKDQSKLKEEGIDISARLGCNSFVDYEIGRVLDAIDETASDALVIYISDHGEALQNHRIDGKGAAMYDEITRVPYIIKWPGVVPENSVCKYPVSHIDLAPTILEAAGIEIPNPIQGNSLLKTLEDPLIKSQTEIFIEFNRYEIDHDGFGGFQPIRCVLDGRYKLVINLLTSDELYDLEKDPLEMNNLINTKEYKKIRNDLHDRLLNWMNESRDPFRGYYWERRPWREDASEATWAYTGMTRQRKPDVNEKRQLDYHTGLEMEKATRKK
ncbi:sulfatase-like hydrolase/transferase [Natronospora cellulosivora (SeqCode)]